MTGRLVVKGLWGDGNPGREAGGLLQGYVAESNARTINDANDALLPTWQARQPKWRKTTKRDVYLNALTIPYVLVIFSFAYFFGRNETRIVPIIFGCIYLGFAIRNFIVVQRKYLRGEDIQVTSFRGNVGSRRPGK